MESGTNEAFLHDGLEEEAIDRTRFRDHDHQQQHRMQHMRTQKREQLRVRDGQEEGTREEGKREQKDVSKEEEEEEEEHDDDLAEEIKAFFLDERQEEVGNVVSVKQEKGAVDAISGWHGLSSTPFEKIGNSVSLLLVLPLLFLFFSSCFFFFFFFSCCCYCLPSFSTVGMES